LPAFRRFVPIPHVGQHDVPAAAVGTTNIKSEKILLASEVAFRAQVFDRHGAITLRATKDKLDRTTRCSRSFNFSVLLLIAY